MSKKTLRKAYAKELALELRGNKKTKNKRASEEELMQLVADASARNSH